MLSTNVIRWILAKRERSTDCVGTTKSASCSRNVARIRAEVNYTADDRRRAGGRDGDVETLKRCYLHSDFTYQVDWDLNRMYRDSGMEI
jgi:hypothetical protein